GALAGHLALVLGTGLVAATKAVPPAPVVGHELGLSRPRRQQLAGRRPRGVGPPPHAPHRRRMPHTAPASPGAPARTAATTRCGDHATRLPPLGHPPDAQVGHRKRDRTLAPLARAGMILVMAEEHQ